MDEALKAVVDAAQAQLDMLERSGDRFAPHALELLLQAIASAVSADASADEGRGFAERVGRWRARQAHVDAHLLTLAAGWACSQCGRSVPAGAVVSGANQPQPRVALVCRNCDAQTLLTRRGYKHFHATFDALREGGAWDPRRNGFVWDLT